MWLPRVTATRALRARASSRALTAALSTNRRVAQVHAATLSSSVPHKAAQEQKIDRFSSRQNDMDTARRLLRDIFGVHSISQEEQTTLQRLLAGENVILNKATSIDQSPIQFIPGLVQGGLTILVTYSKSSARNCAWDLENRGLRAAYLDAATFDSINVDEFLVQCSELDVLLFTAGFPTAEYAQILIESGFRVAFLTFYGIERVSKLSRGTYKYFARVFDAVLALQPQNILCTTSRLVTDELIDDIQQTWGLSGSVVIARRKIRSNLVTDAITLRRNHDKFPTIISLLDKIPDRTVIVTATSSGAQQMAGKLQENGYDARAIATEDQITAKITPFHPSIFNEPNRILCVPKKQTKHLFHQDIRHLILQSLAISPAEFEGFIQVAGRDGATSRCTVLLSDQEVFNVDSSTRSLAPSLQQIRLLIANIFQGRENLKCGSEFVVEAVRLRLLSDLTIEELDNFLQFLDEQDVLCVQKSHAADVSLGPCLESAHKTASHPLEIDLVHELQKATGSSLSKEITDGFEPWIASGFLQKDLISFRKAFKSLRLKKDAEVSLAEVDSLVQRWGSALRLDLERRLNRRREYIKLFTTARCFVASLAKSVPTDVPPGWTNCGRCLFCVTHKPVAVVPLSQIEQPISQDRLSAVIRAVPPRYTKDPRFLARLALGVLSFRVKIFELDRNRKVFGSMRLNRFEDLLKAFAKRVGVPLSNFHEL